VDGGDDAIGVSGPHEGLGSALVRRGAVDGGLEVDNRADTPRLSRRRVSLENKVSTALSQEHDFGVKWKTKRGCRASQAFHLGMLCGCIVVEDDVNDLPTGVSASTALRKRMTPDGGAAACSGR